MNYLLLTDYFEKLKYTEDASSRKAQTSSLSQVALYFCWYNLKRTSPKLFPESQESPYWSEQYIVQQQIFVCAESQLMRQSTPKSGGSDLKANAFSSCGYWLEEYQFKGNLKETFNLN